MELVVVLSVVLAGAVGAAGFALVWRRQGEKARQRAEEMRALDERISARISELKAKRIGRQEEPIGAPETHDEGLPISEPLPVETERRSPARLGDAGPAAEEGGGGRKRRLTVRTAVAVAAIVVVFLLLVRSQLPSTLPPQATSTPIPTFITVLLTGTPNLLSPTPQSTPNPEATPTPTSSLGAPTPTPLVYVVRLGDTMTKIAQDFDVTLVELIAANPQITDPSLIYAGNEITIPTPRPSPGASPVASAVP